MNYHFCICTCLREYHSTKAWFPQNGKAIITKSHRKYSDFVEEPLTASGLTYSTYGILCNYHNLI